MHSSHHRHSTLAQPALVSFGPQLANRRTVRNTRLQTVPCTPSRTSDTAPTSGPAPVVGMQTLRGIYHRKGYSNSATEVMINARRGSTYKQYATYLSAWFSHCNIRNIDPVRPTVPQAVNFMDLIRSSRQLGYSACNTMRSALSSIIVCPNNIPLGQHPEVKLFMKGCYQQQPPTPRYIDTWDPNKVLDLLRRWTPPTDITFKKLTLKVVMLLLLVSGQRVQTLKLLDITNMHQTDSRFSFIITSHLKQSRPGYKNPKLVFKSYSIDPSICIVLYLAEYIRRTVDLRAQMTSLLLTIKKPHRPATKNTISRWVKETMTLAGIDTAVYGPHSVRSASTSAAKRGGASIQDILDTAGWSNATTFAKFYNREIVDNVSTFDIAVLDSNN